METQINQTMRAHLAEVEKQHNLIYLGLMGSQNYGLSTENSDVDTKAIILPSIEDIALNRKMVSETVKFNDGAQCDVKDVREMVRNFLKQNINFLEILFTDYYICSSIYKDFVSFLRDNAERIAHYNPVGCIRAMYGMSLEKLKLLEKSTPISQDKIEAYGYDPKQLCHIVRLRQFVEDYLKGKSFAECLKCEHKNYLLRIKNGEFDLTTARAIAETETRIIAALVDEHEFIPGDMAIKEELDEQLILLFKKEFEER